MDLRQRDVSKEDLVQARDVLFEFASFDTDTKWPAAMPDGYDPGRILELGKDPGLGVRELHRQGITGKGVRVAFLDQTLLVDHQEYKDRVERYREIGRVAPQAEMHGAAVLSILAGKTLGVAPEASVTYYAIGNVTGDRKVTWINHATAIHEILDENEKLPREKQIRIIGVSLGYSPDLEGYKEIKEAVARAKKAGVLVLTTSVHTDYNFRFHGLGRDPLADPNTNSYRPGIWWHKQVKPDLTPDGFYQAAVETGSYTEFTRDGQTYQLGPIIHPAALIKRLQGK